MVQVTEQQIQSIVQRVLVEVAAAEGPGAKAAPPFEPQAMAVAPEGDGIFPDTDSAVAEAAMAFRQLNAMTLAKRDKLVANMRRVMRHNVELLSWMAREETGLGRYEDKVEKNLLVINKTPGAEDLKTTAYTGDRGMTLMEWAPYGVIASITPSTNPTATIICNAIGMVAAGNAVVFNAHPGAKKCSTKNIQLLNQAIVRAGGPPNLITGTAEPTIQSAQQLMRHPQIRLLVVTGGEGVVREAMSSGKRAICAGPGNPPVVVDETAIIEQAARDIVKGASFDNNIICIDEKEIFAVDAIADKLKAAMKQHGAYEITHWQLRRLERVLFTQLGPPRKPGVINKDFIGKDACVILKEIGINVGREVRLVLVEVERDHPLVWTEQMMPVIPLVRVRNADEGIDLAKEAENGFGHTAVMHSRRLDHLDRMAREINTSIFVKNGPSLAGLGYGGEGYTSFSIASPTGEGLTGPRSFSRERRCTLVDHFRIV